MSYRKAQQNRPRLFSADLIILLLLFSQHSWAQDKGKANSERNVVTVDVPASQRWIKTGVQLTTSQALNIDAKGTINWFTGRCLLCIASPNWSTLPWSHSSSIYCSLIKMLFFDRQDR